MTAPAPRRHRIPTWLLLAISAVGIYLAFALGGDPAPGTAGRSPEEAGLLILLGLLLLVLVVLIIGVGFFARIIYVLLREIAREAQEERRTHGR